MPSLIQQLAQAQTQAQLAPTQRKRVVVYAPGRGLPQAPVRQQQPRGVQARPAGARPPRSGSVNRSAERAAAEAELASAAAQEQQEQAQKQAQEQAEDAQPWYKKGLGMVIGNPIVSNVLKPLGVLGTLGRGVTYGVETVAEKTGLGDIPEWMKVAGAMNPLTAPISGLAALAGTVDTERTEADDRSFYEKVLDPSSDYGFGQLLNPDLPGYISKPAGFLGDVGLDPLTYVTGGATRIAGGIEKAGKLAQAAKFADEAAKFTDEAARLAGGATLKQAGAASKAQRAAAEAEAMARRLTADAEAIIPRKVALRQGRKGRASFLGEIAEAQPELYDQYRKQLTRAGEQGFNTIKDPALREVLGLQAPGLRMMGAPLPKTGGLVEGAVQVGGKLRQGMNKAPILGSVGAKFAPSGLEEPLQVLTRGAEGDALKAATTVRIQNLMRRGAGEMEGRGNKALTDMVRQLRKLGGEDEIRSLVRQAETDPKKNLLNEFFGDKMPELYEKVAGRGMEVTRDKATYIPHMHTPQGRRFLATLDPEMVEKDMGFAVDDLLEGSKYLEKSRKLAPDTPGVPKEFKIGDRGTITLTDGTIDELNEELGRLFPEFKGKFYQDDPVTIGESYVSSVARQAGRDLALDRLADSPNPLVREVTGQLAEDVKLRNAWARQNPITAKVRAGYAAGQRLVPAKPKGEAPTTASDDVLAWTKHKAETQAQRNYLMKEGKEYVADVGKDVSKTRSTIADNLKALRTTLMGGLKKKESEATAQIKALNVQLGRMDEEIRKIGPLSSENVDDLVGVHQTVDNHIVTTKAEIKKIRDRYGKKLPRDVARVDTELGKTLRHLEDQLERVRQQYAKGSREMRAEARARKTALEAPVEEAQKRLDQAEAAFPRPVPRQKVQEANVRIRTNFESEDAFELDRQRFADELKRMRDEGIPIYRTIDGRLTPETTEAVQAAVAESRKVAPPPPDIPTPPPSATVSSATPEERLKQAMARQTETPAAAPIEIPPEVAEGRVTTPAPAPTPPPAPSAEQLAKNVQQKLKTTNKMVRDGEKRVTEATTKLTEATAAGAPPEDIRKLEYGVKQARDRLNEARTFQQDAAREAAAAPETGVAGGAGGKPAPEAPPAPPAAVPPPAVPDTQLVKQADGSYVSADEFKVVKETKGWRVTLADEDDFGLFKSLKEAREEVAAQQEMAAIPIEGEIVEPAAARAATTEVTPPPGPEPAAVAPVVETTTPKTKRITRRWIRKEGAGGKEVDALTGTGEGWTVEAYEESIKGQPTSQARGYLPPKEPGPRLPHAPIERGVEAQGPRRTRYIAYHATDNSMRARSFASAREAKIAVEDLLRRQRHQTTAAEYAAAGERRLPQVEATYENLSGLVPETVSGLTPEEAAANRAAVQAVPTQPKLPPKAGVYGPNELALTPEGAALEAMRPPPATISDPYYRAYDDWQAMLARSQDMSLSKTERNKATRQARTMGADFTQTTGKYYQRRADEQVMINDEAWRLERDADLAVTKARQDYEAAVAKADAQVEAMVYTKHHNPITGDDEYTRLPSGSTVGFGGEAERVPVPIEPPRQGEVPTGVVPEPGAWKSRYAPGDRAADRRVISEEVSSMVMMPENERAYLDLVAQSNNITERLDASAANDNRLNQLDEAAKAAYTEEVRAADEAVAEAKRLEARAQADQEAGNVMGAGLAYEEAKRNTQRVIDEQTAARQAWMDADREWKQALADRDAYVKAQDDASRFENQLASETREAQKFIDAARRNEPTPQVANPKGGMRDAPHNIQTLTRNLRQAYQKVDAMDAAGATFLTETQRRDLVGQLNSIDLGKRDLINQAFPGRVKPGAAVVPREGLEEGRLADMIRQRPGQSLERFGFETEAQKIPPVRGTGQDELTARAYAESLEPTEPGARTTWSLSEEGALQGREQITGRQPYKPRTEREAIAGLEEQAADIEASPTGAALRQEEANIGRQQTAERQVAEDRKAEIELLGRAERDEKLMPLKDRAQTLASVGDALHQKEQLIPRRAEAQAQRKVVVDAKVTKKADIVKIADDLERVAKQNPDLLDDDMAVTEALLQDARDEATRVNDNDLTAKQVQGLIDKVGTKNDKSLDIMLTTVGKNWKMLYDSYGSKKGILKEGDLILQADLHRMFRNLYDLDKDKVLFGRTLNALTNLFKTYATLSPGFHVRNALSAIFMNATDGVALKTQFNAAQIWREYMKAENGEEWLANVSSLHGFSGDQIRDAFAATYGSGAGGRFTEQGFAEALDTGHWQDRLNWLQRNKLTRLSQRAGERVEGSVRLAMGLDSVKRGESVEATIQRINRIHFDYGEISKMDANMKRIVPFWTFMSRNMPMQVSQMWTHPQVYLGYERFVRNFSATNEEYTPEYWTKAGAWNSGFKVPDFVPEGFGGGLPIYVQPDLGFTRLESDLKDYEDFLSLKRPGAVLSAGNPLLTAPVEYATRTDIFTGQRFEEGETVPVGGVMSPVKWLAQALGRTEGGEVDAAFMNAMRAINPILDRETRLLPQATGGDPEAIKRQGESWARFLGAPVRGLTPKQQDNEFFRRYYDQLEAAKLQQARAQRQAG